MPSIQTENSIAKLLFTKANIALPSIANIGLLLNQALRTLALSQFDMPYIALHNPFITLSSSDSNTLFLLGTLTQKQGKLESHCLMFYFTA